MCEFFNYFSGISNIGPLQDLTLSEGEANSLQELSYVLEAAFDFKESRKQGRVVIASGIFKQLDD